MSSSSGTSGQPAAGSMTTRSEADKKFGETGDVTYLEKKKGPSLPEDPFSDDGGQFDGIQPDGTPIPGGRRRKSRRKSKRRKSRRRKSMKHYS
jgi:hypothetical protein